MWVISAVSLSVTMLLCVVGVFIPRAYYDDNLAQRIGMAGVFMFCWPRLVQLLERQELTSIAMPAAAQIVGHVGLAMFAVGTAYKAWKHRPMRGNKGNPPARRATDFEASPRGLKRVDALRVIGRGKA